VEEDVTMSKYIPRVGDAYLVTTDRYYEDRIMTIVAVTDDRVYWDLEHRRSVNRAYVDGDRVRYFDAIDKQYFSMFATKAGLELGERPAPSWEL
jgi:hypothetical protein